MSGPVGLAVILDRVADVAQADTVYCVHGRVTCVVCGAWCWLGSLTHDLVLTGGYTPRCKPCCNRLGLSGEQVVGNAGDHRRADGPH